MQTKLKNINPMKNMKCFMYGHDLTSHGHIQVCERCGLTGGYENPYFEDFFIGVLPYMRYLKHKIDHEVGQARDNHHAQA
jgi:hypothetical protein